MQREFVVSEEQHLKRLSTYILNCIRKQEKLTVIVKPFSPDITAQQRGLYWLWMTDMGNEFGEDKEYYHRMFKVKYLVNIFRNNPKKDWYNRMLQELVNLKKYSTAEGLHDLQEGIIKLTSIMDAERAEMAEYMECIKNFAQGEMGFAVRQPDDGLLNY